MTVVDAANAYDEHWLAGPQATRFYCRTYTAPTPQAILVFLHGFIEHIGRFAHVFPRWQARGVHVFAFDQRGFGRTAEDREHRSPDSSYAKTSGGDQLEDAEWAVQAAKKQFGDGLPVFVMGHSMGGAVALDFAIHTKTPLAGIIASSPLILQTSAAPKIARWVGGKVSLLTPYTLIPAQVKAEDLSHDKEVNSAYLKDPLIKQKGTLRGISDMLNRGEALLKTQCRKWPEDLPLLIIHGTADKVTSHAASQRFYDETPSNDKKISFYPEGFHELHNEPDGVKDKFIDECISWVHAHSSATTPPAKL
ncbi:hypothetical protein M0805_004699 [Coniferiporia weirii]|nr:hypothetical protein M0805_004699 [Coniferiporia weirii]